MEGWHKRQVAADRVVGQCEVFGVVGERRCSGIDGDVDVGRTRTAAVVGRNGVHGSVHLDIRYSRNGTCGLREAQPIRQGWRNTVPIDRQTCSCEQIAVGLVVIDR